MNNPLHQTCLEKQEKLIQELLPLGQGKQLYEAIMQMGKNQTELDQKYKTEDNLVKGCQSIMFLHTEFRDSKLYFSAYSDALISAGLAQLLIKVYNEESAATILTCPPTFIEKLGLTNLLTPNRAQGLLSLHLKMKREAMNYLVAK